MSSESLTLLHIIFFGFAFVAVSSAVAVITLKNPVRSVLSLVVTFFAMAGIWMILHAEFLSLILVLVYVGAVMTLFLFVVMMLNITKEDERAGFVRYLPLGTVVILVLTGLIIAQLKLSNLGALQMPQTVVPADFSNTAQLGSVLFTDYVYPFEVAGVLLLAAIIAAITLAHRGPRQRKIQSPSAQINIGPEDSVRLVKMKSE